MGRFAMSFLVLSRFLLVARAVVLLAGARVGMVRVLTLGVLHSLDAEALLVARVARTGTRAARLTRARILAQVFVALRFRTQMVVVLVMVVRILIRTVGIASMTTVVAMAIVVMSRMMSTAVCHVWRSDCVFSPVCVFFFIYLPDPCSGSCTLLPRLTRTGP